MDVKFTHLCNFFFHLLILLGSYGNGVMEMHSERSRNNVDMRIEQVHSHASSSSHMDPSNFAFFFIEDLKQGSTMPVYFPRRKVDPSLLLSTEEADSIPFASKELHNLLDYFSFSQDSPQAKIMEITLNICEAKPMKNETKFCATSWKSMLDFVQITCGLGKQIKSFSTTYNGTNSGPILQKYTVMGIQTIAAPKVVACHTIPYPYTIYFCHHDNSDRMAFTVSLTGENGDRAEATALCHMDTSMWNRNHPGIQFLGIEPGSFPVCHFFPSDEFIWVPSNSQA